METKIFVNLPVKDLQRSMEFFGELGFGFNPQFTDENAACMIISDELFVMLLVEDYFKTFTKKRLTDASKSTEMILALFVESKEAVDRMVKKALTSGGTAFDEPNEQGFMYGWSFQDPDDHLWEVGYMDPIALHG